MTIWKYPLEMTDRQTITMPWGANILTVQMQQGHPMLWALVNEKYSRCIDRTIVIYGTGHAIVDTPGPYLGTFQVNDGELIFHVFEMRELEDR